MTFVVVLCLLPAVALLVADGVAEIAKCQLDEGGVHPCVIAGLDLGSFLYFSALGGLVSALFALPLLTCIVAIWGICEAVAWWHRRGMA